MFYRVMAAASQRKDHRHCTKQQLAMALFYFS